VDYKNGHAITSPPLIVKDLVVTGYAGVSTVVRGALQAYKQDSGEMVWKTHTIPGPGEPATKHGRVILEGRCGSTWYVVPMIPSSISCTGPPATPDHGAAIRVQ